MKSAGNEIESREDRFLGQFFFVSTQAPAGPEKDESFEEPAAVGKVTLHSMDYWVIDSGATFSMTPRADLLTELELSPNVLWVPNLAANLISVRRLEKAGTDDILLFRSSMKEIQKVQQELMKNFKCKTLGEVKYYLRMHVERDLDHRWLKLHQEKYGIENERNVATPLPAEFKLVKAAEDEGVEAEEQQQFQSLVGSLLYAAVHTRPDISFSVGQLARVVQNPSEEQVDAAERVVKYLNSHPSIGVQYSASAQVKQKWVEVLKEKVERLGEGKLFLTCFTDAMWASEKDDSSSVGGYICVIRGGTVSWRSKKQTETALSSVESEYMAMFHGVKEVIWLRRLLEEIGQEQKVATPVFFDSKGALGMASNAVLYGLNKHMCIKWHGLRKR
ncbi:unnamed protein product [Closterium sp. NIES-54]